MLDRAISMLQTTALALYNFQYEYRGSRQSCLQETGEDFERCLKSHVAFTREIKAQFDHLQFAGLFKCTLVVFGTSTS